MLNKKIAFIDIEANQVKRKIYMLEFSIFDEESEECIKFVECKHNFSLNIEVRQLLKKEKFYYKNKIISEKQAYKELLKISEKYEIICFGDYDKVILDSVAERYNLEKIELRNYLDELKQIFNLDKNKSPSLNNFKNICEIDWNLENEHNSKWDAKYLKQIFLKVNKNKENKTFIQEYKNRLKLELLRPKKHKFKQVKTVEVFTRKNYKIIFLSHKKIKEEDVNNPKNLMNIKVEIYDNKMQLISSFNQILKNVQNDYISNENFNLIKKQILNKEYRYIKNLLIFNGKTFWNKFFRKTKMIYLVPNKISEDLFNKSELSNEQKVRLIRLFYKDGSFNNKINYKKIINEFKIN